MRKTIKQGALLPEDVHLLYLDTLHKTFHAAYSYGPKTPFFPQLSPPPLYPRGALLSIGHSLLLPVAKENKKVKPTIDKS
jgi:hypothetical protein